MKLPIYLDHASTTPVDPRVVDKMKKCLSLEGNYGNPASRSHEFGWKAEKAVEEARASVANLVNCDVREIVWTSGATEADNLAIKGAANGIADIFPNIGGAFKIKKPKFDIKIGVVDMPVVVMVV